MVVPVRLSFVRAPAHPGYPVLKAHKMVVVVNVHVNSSDSLLALAV